MRQCRHRLTLRTGAHHHDLVGAMVIDLLQVHQHVRGNLQVAQLPAMVMLRTMEGRPRARPYGHAQRLHPAPAALGERARRRDATMMRPLASRKTFDSTGPICSILCRGKPGTSALVESGRNRSTPSSPRRAKWLEVGDAAIQRQLVHLGHRCAGTYPPGYG